MRKTASPLILSIIVLFASCGDPNIYSHMGYDPAGRPLPVETVRAENGENFNLLSLISGYDGNIRIIYKEENKNYDLLRSLSEEGRIRLVQTVDYLSRYGDLGSYLAGPLDDDTLDACKDTIAFVILIIDDIEGNVTTILNELTACSKNSALWIGWIRRRWRTSYRYSWSRTLSSPASRCSTSYCSTSLTTLPNTHGTSSNPVMPGQGMRCFPPSLEMQDGWSRRSLMR